MMTDEQDKPPVNAASADSFQSRVQPWMMACFGAEISSDCAERNHRFLEESLELVQACGCTASEAHQLVDYVFGRPVGERAQEVGGVMVTLAALCLAQGLDMHAAGETELARIWTKVEAIRAKQAAKPKHSPLPAAATVAVGRVDTPEFREALNAAVMCKSSMQIQCNARLLDHIDGWGAQQREAGWVDGRRDQYQVAIDQRNRAEKAEARVKELETELDIELERAYDRLLAARSTKQNGRQAQQADGKHPAPCARSCEAPAYQSQLRGRDARIAELEALLARRRIPLSPETQQAIADARAAGQTIAATPGGLVFMNDGAEPGSGELDCPACGGSGHAGDVVTGSVA